MQLQLRSVARRQTCAQSPPTGTHHVEHRSGLQYSSWGDRTDQAKCPPRIRPGHLRCRRRASIWSCCGAAYAVLGCIDKGDHGAASGQDLSAFDFDTRLGRAALRDARTVRASQAESFTENYTSGREGSSAARAMTVMAAVARKWYSCTRVASVRAGVARTTCANGGSDARDDWRAISTPSCGT